MRLAVLTILMLLPVMTAAHANVPGDLAAAEIRAQKRAVAEEISTRIRHALNGETMNGEIISATEASLRRSRR